eukprot:6175890-Pleurochrysis_carterae.AAC.2
MSATDISYLACCRTADANKSHYAQMVVSRIYWGMALRNPLQSAYATQSARSSLSIHTLHAAWDMFIERVNQHCMLRSCFKGTCCKYCRVSGVYRQH